MKLLHNGYGSIYSIYLDNDTVRTTKIIFQGTQEECDAEIKRLNLEPNLWLVNDLKRQRENMKVTRLKGRLLLSKKIYLGDVTLLDEISSRIALLPESSEVRIYWEHSETYDRTHPVLNKFLKEDLGMSDKYIDSLFKE